LDEAKSKHAGLAQQNGFGPVFLKSRFHIIIQKMMGFDLMIISYKNYQFFSR
jgi:hypothetical protein